MQMHVLCQGQSRRVGQPGQIREGGPGGTPRARLARELPGPKGRAANATLHRDSHLPPSWGRQHWQAGPDLAGVRARDGLARVPAKEREQWRQLWSDVDALLRRVSQARASE
jgi:hypothetical protein